MSRIKFKLALKELVFEFEGDRETGEKMQSAIGRTLDSLTDAQNQVLDVKARTINNQEKLLESSLVGSVDRRKPSRRRRGRLANTHNENGQENTGSRSTSELSRLLDQLVQEGYFRQTREVGDVRAELAKRGHHFESRGVATPLLNLTRRGVLQRDNTSGKWQYIEANADVDSGS